MAVSLNIDDFIKNPSKHDASDISSGYKDLVDNHVTTKTEYAGTGHETTTVSLKSGAVSQAEKHAEYVKSLETAPGMDKKIIEAQQLAKKGNGVGAHAVLDKAQAQSNKAMTEFQEVRNELLTKRGAKGANVAEIDAALEHLGKEEAKATGVIAETNKIIGESRTKVAAVTGVQPAVAKGATVVSTAEKAVLEKGWFKKAFSKEGAFKTASTPMKFVRGAGVAAGVVLVGAGLKDFGRLVGVVSPKLDEEGKELPRGAGTLFKGFAETGLGAGALYFSLVKAGKGQTMGSH